MLKNGRKTIIVTPAKREKGTPGCIKCGVAVTPGFCYTGKVLQGFGTIVRAVEEVHDDTSVDVKVYRIPTVFYDRGYLCDDCASDYRTVIRRLPGGEHERIPVVQTDSTLKPAGDEVEGKRSWKGFNTRITR